jgi:PAS domain S-box-containing protein
MNAATAEDLPISLDLLLHTIWDRIETGLIVYGPDCERRMVNPAASAMLKDGRGHITARVVYLADGLTLCPEAELPLTRALAGKIVRHEELVVCDEGHPEGRRMLTTAYPIPMADGRNGALIAFYDVTERWRDEQSNRTSLVQLNMLLNGAAGYAILQLTPAGNVNSWSDNAQRLLGYEQTEIIGQPYSVLFTAPDRTAGVPEAILAQAREHGVAQTTGERRRADGSSFWADGVMTAIRDRAGEVTAFVKVIRSRRWRS